MFYHCFQSNVYEGGRQSYEDFEREHGKKNTNKLIKGAYDFFVSRIELELESRKTKEEKISYLNELSDKVREKMAIISITVTDIRDAYNIFETINQRGVELAVSDLFKNYLISHSRNRDEMVRVWERIFDILDIKLKSFLKHYWHSKKGVVQESGLFRELINYVEDDSENVDVDLLTKEIEREAKIYSVLQDPDDEYWDGEDNEILELLFDFKNLKLKQVLPLLVVGKINFSKDEFKKLLKYIVNFQLRYVVCMLPYNVLERKYSDIAIRIRQEPTLGGITLPKILSAKEVITELSKLEKYPNNPLFEESFRSASFKDDSYLAKFILKKVEIAKFRKSNPRECNTEPLDYDRFTLEHILPQNPDEEWVAYFLRAGVDLKEAMAWRYQIGNMTLLDEKKNGFSKNAFITKKCERAYNHSLLKINEPLKNLTDWNKENIQKRTSDLLEAALDIWKIEF